MKKALIYTTALVALGSASVAHAGGDAVFVQKKAAKKTAKASSKKANKEKVAYAPKASVAASGLAVTLGGELDFAAASVSQDDTVDFGTGKEPAIYTNGDFAQARDLVFSNKSEIHVKAEGKTDSGLVYGGVVELEADVSDSRADQGVNADKTYIFVDSTAGKVELGATEGVAQRLNVNAGSNATISGGVGSESTLGYYVPLAGFITKAQTALDFVGDKAEDANKISYYSPKIEGFQAGLSFTPDSGDAGTADKASGEKNGFFQFENVFTAAIKYANEFDGVGVEASIAGEFGGAEDFGYGSTTDFYSASAPYGGFPYSDGQFFGYDIDAGQSDTNVNLNDVAKQEDLNAFHGGLKVSYEGFSIAGSYSDFGDTGEIKDTNGNKLAADAKLYSVGLGYSQKDFAVSAGYLSSEIYDNEFTNISVGADYKLAPGFVPYAEVNIFDAEYSSKAKTGTDDLTVDNSGTVVILGTKLNF